MKILYNFVALLCAMALSFSSLSQEKMWYIAGGLGFAGTDGSNPLPCAWKNPELYGYSGAFVMQASTGDVYVVNTEGGEVEDEEHGIVGYGAIARVSKDGMQRITGLGYAQTHVYMTEGKNGYIYGVRSNAFAYYLFRFKIDGSDYSETYFSTYGMRASELATTAAGEIMGTSSYHLYKMKPDISGIEKVYAYQKATGNSPVGKLHYSNDGYLYGATKLGGTGNYGVVYRVKPDGTGYTVLHNFNIANGRYPDRGLTEDASGYLYGVTRQGGQFHKGVLFRIHKSGSGFEILHHFTTEGPNNYYDEQDLPTNVQLAQNGTILGEVPNKYHHSMFIYNLATRRYREPYSNDAVITDIHVFREVTPNIQVLSPADGAVNVRTSDPYKVSNVTGAAWYDIQFSTDPGFSTNVITVDFQESTTIPPVNLVPNTKYYTRAKSSLWPYFGKVTSFTTSANMVYGFVSNPKDGATNVEAPTLKITANQISGAKRYVIQISTTPDFSSDVNQRESSVDYQRTMEFHGLSYQTKYYARMKTDVSSDFGRVTSFTTKSEPMAFSQDAIPLDVHPNPSTDYFRLTSTAPADVQISVTKLTGELMSTHALSAGSALDVGQDFPKGIYIMRIVSAEGVVIKRLVKE